LKAKNSTLEPLFQAEKRKLKMFGDLSQQTFDLLNKTDMSALNKTTISQSLISGVSGNLNAFDLSGLALQLYPVITPLRNRLPRQLSDRGDLATRWKAITGVNTSNFELGVAPGRRSAEMSVTEQDYVASYAGIGLEGSVDWEAVWAGGKEFDNKATLAPSSSIARKFRIHCPAWTTLPSFAAAGTITRSSGPSFLASMFTAFMRMKCLSAARHSLSA
jgi:hypothetical protein